HAAIVGSKYEVAAPDRIRTGTITRDDDPTGLKLRQLAGFLAGDQPTPSITDVVDNSPGAATGPSSSSDRRTWMPYATAGGSLLAFGAGAVFLHYDGKGTCDAPNGQCAQVYGTKPAGYTCIGVGAAFAVVTAYLLWPRSTDGARQISIAPTSGGVFAM